MSMSWRNSFSDVRFLKCVENLASNFWHKKRGTANKAHWGLISCSPFTKRFQNKLLVSNRISKSDLCFFPTADK